MKKNITDFYPQPLNKEELIQSIGVLILKGDGCYLPYNYNANLNALDVSLVKDFSWLFGKVHEIKYKYLYDDGEVREYVREIDFRLFNGTFDKWNTKSLENTSYTFYESRFNRHKIAFNMEKVENISHMFEYASYSHDFKAKTPNLIMAESAFENSVVPYVSLNLDNVENIDFMFANTKLEMKDLDIDFSFLKGKGWRDIEWLGFAFNSNINLLEDKFTKETVLEKEYGLGLIGVFNDEAEQIDDSSRMLFFGVENYQFLLPFTEYDGEVGDEISLLAFMMLSDVLRIKKDEMPDELITLLEDSAGYGLEVFRKYDDEWFAENEEYLFDESDDVTKNPHNRPVHRSSSKMNESSKNNKDDDDDEDMKPKTVVVIL